MSGDSSVLAAPVQGQATSTHSKPNALRDRILFDAFLETGGRVTIDNNGVKVFDANNKEVNSADLPTIPGEQIDVPMDRERLVVKNMSDAGFLFSLRKASIG